MLTAGFLFILEAAKSRSPSVTNQKGREKLESYQCLPTSQAALVRPPSWPPASQARGQRFGGWRRRAVVPKPVPFGAETYFQEKCPGMCRNLCRNPLLEGFRQFRHLG